MALKSGIINGHFIGLKNLHIAELKTDELGGAATYGDCISIPEIISINIQPQKDEASLYADNQSVETATTTQQFKLEIELANLPLEYKAFLLGHSFTGGVMTVGKDDVAPYVGISFETNKSNGKKRLMKFLKVKFSEPDENPQTKGENIEFNTPTISGTAIFRMSDSLCYKAADEEADGFDADTVTDWFTAM